MKAAIVHDWLTGMRGGERCLEVFCEVFPDAPIYTLIHVKGSVSQIIEQHKIISSSLSSFSCIAANYRYFLPFFPYAIRSFNLKGFDLILSSSHCVAKGVKVPPNTCHVSYVHTPMRYVWDQYDEYFGKGKCSKLAQISMSGLRRSLQKWDRQSNSGISNFLANSQNVADRIWRHYGEKAEVIHPPVDCSRFQISNIDEGFYLIVSALAPYKKIGLAIEAANQEGFSLKIVGGGPEEARLRKLAGPTVEFLGWQTDAQVGEWYRRCRALLFPGEEDFGIVPLEAMATGKPVIAFGKGGALETVIPLRGSTSSPSNFAPPTGVFFYEQSSKSMIEAIRIFEKYKSSFDGAAIRIHAQQFDRPLFKHRIDQMISIIYHQFQQAHAC